MAQITLKINGYAYNIGCKDGEEPHLLAMAAEIEERVTRAKGLGSQSGESRLLVMAALMMADELHDMQAEMKSGGKGRAEKAPDKASGERARKLASRAEAIATAVEQE